MRTTNQKNETPLPKHMHKAGPTGSVGWCFIFHFSLEACTQIGGFVMRLSVVTPKPSVAWSPKLVLTTGRRGASQEWNSPLVSSRLRKTWTGSRHNLQKGIAETLLALTSCFWMNETLCSEILLLSRQILHCLTNHGSSPDLQPVVAGRWSVRSPSSWPQNLRARKLRLKDFSNQHVL